MALLSVMPAIGIPRSLRLDVCRPDHLAPLLGFVSDKAAKAGKRHRHRLNERRLVLDARRRLQKAYKL